MAKTFAVGDSVALGIGQAIPGAQIIAHEGRTVATMQPLFNSALAAVEKGDTVIISAGYNSTGANGMSADDLKLLQTNVTALAEKGAKVVIAPLREEWPQGGKYAALKGLSSKTNKQLRSITGATVAEDCIAVANGLANGEVHGSYDKLSSICTATAAKIAAPAAAVANTDGGLTEGEKLAASADAKGGGLMDGLMDFISMIGDLLKGIGEKIAEVFSSIFGSLTGSGDDKVASNDGAAKPDKPKDEGKGAPDAKAKEEALAAAKGNSAAGTGKDVADNGTPSLPEAKGPKVKAVG